MQQTTNSSHVEEWDFYMSHVNNKPASFFLDLGLREAAPIADKPYVLWVAFTIQNPTEDGFPTNEETEMLYAIEDALADEIVEQCQAVFAGRLTTNGKRCLYFYLNNKGSCKKVIKQSISKFPAYEFEYKIKKDRSWELYREFLYPDPRQYQDIMNRRVIHNLQRQGDSLTQKRMVDHWIIFDSEKDMQSYIEEVKQEGFEVIDSSQHDDGVWSLNIGRVDKADYESVNEYTLYLCGLAKEHNGSYDGWGCPLIKDIDEGKPLFRRLHEDGRHGEIIEAILKLPEEERDYELVGMLARAYNNLEMYGQAAEHLLTVKELGENDSLWNFRLAYAYYYAGEKEKALELFEKSKALNPDEQDVDYFILQCRNDIEKKEKGIVDPWDFLFSVAEKFFARMQQDEEAAKEFTASQHTLLAYNYLYGQVCNGGFIQLIQNGYGSYVFDNPVSDYLRGWGVEKIAEIIDRAKLIYEKYQEELNRETSIEEFSALYDKIKDFESLEDEFYAVMNAETELVKQYVEKHLEDFELAG